MGPKDAGKMVNGVHPGQTAPSVLFPNLSVETFKIIAKQSGNFFHDSTFLSLII